MTASLALAYVPAVTNKQISMIRNLLSVTLSN